MRSPRPDSAGRRLRTTRERAAKTVPTMASRESSAAMPTSWRMVSSTCMQRYADHQGADGRCRRRRSGSRRPDSGRVRLGSIELFVPSVGTPANWDDGGLGKRYDRRATLAGGTTLGEPPTCLGRAVIVVEHGQRADGLTGAEQTAVGTANRPGIAPDRVPER